MGKNDVVKKSALKKIYGMKKFFGNGSTSTNKVIKYSHQLGHKKKITLKNLKNPSHDS